jgi:hypothetical protein
MQCQQKKLLVAPEGNGMQKRLECVEVTCDGVLAKPCPVFDIPFMASIGPWSTVGQ